MKLVITPPAQQKLLDIYAYTYGRWGSKKATDYLHSMDATVTLIAKHPQVGRHYPGTHPSWLYFNHSHEYRVFYKRTKSALYILRILHQRQEPAAAILSENAPPRRSR
jgi:plasmid stabilization system protein ParE